MKSLKSQKNSDIVVNTFDESVEESYFRIIEFLKNEDIGIIMKNI